MLSGITQSITEPLKQITKPALNLAKSVAEPAIDLFKGLFNGIKQAAPDVTKSLTSFIA